MTQEKPKHVMRKRRTAIPGLKWADAVVPLYSDWDERFSAAIVCPQCHISIGGGTTRQALDLSYDHELETHGKVLG